MRIESPADQRPLIHFTFNNFASVQKPMSLSLMAVDSEFDTLSFYGVYKDLPSGAELTPHHDIELPRKIDIRFLSFPIVIDHPDALENMLRKLNASKLTNEQEHKLVPLRVALKMHEIANLVAAGVVSPGSNGMVPAIYKAIDNDTGKPIVGWRFEPETSLVGSLTNYDRGAGIHQNTDAIILWKHPKLPANIERMKQWQLPCSEHGVFLKNDGSLTLGLLKFNPHFQGGYFSFNHSPISEQELNDIKLISPLPTEDYLPKHPVSDLKVGDKVVAWENLSSRKLYSGPYYEFGEVKDNNSNGRFQGYSGFMFNGDPLSSFRHYQTMDEIANSLLIHQYNSTYESALRKFEKPALNVTSTSSNETVSHAVGMKQ